MLEVEIPALDSGKIRSSHGPIPRNAGVRVRPKIRQVGDYPWRQSVALKVASQAEIVPQVRRALGFSITGTAQMAANSNKSNLASGRIQ